MKLNFLIVNIMLLSIFLNQPIYGEIFDYPKDMPNGYELYGESQNILILVEMIKKEKNSMKKTALQSQLEFWVNFQEKTFEPSLQELTNEIKICEQEFRQTSDIERQNQLLNNILGLKKNIEEFQRHLSYANKLRQLTKN